MRHVLSSTSDIETLNIIASSSTSEDEAPTSTGNILRNPLPIITHLPLLPLHLLLPILFVPFRAKHSYQPLQTNISPTKNDPQVPPLLPRFPLDHGPKVFIKQRHRK